LALGKGTGAEPLTDEQVRNELVQSNESLVAAGLPSPHYCRAPYGAVSPASAAVAANLGLRLIPDSTDDGVFIDSGDWAGLTPERITNRVTGQMVAMLAVQDHPTLVVTFHDGIRTAPDMIKALPLIVAWMNANNVSATTTMPGAAG
jgi:peptidoglycan/xylan/chitin deacetylase (PgdA/CDA1 family)